jgi:protein-S-isoprenylcysteine O-methyltransferase Ste14
MKIIGVDSIVKIFAVSVWLGAEAYLIVKDRARGKGTTAIDQRTRNYNTAATVVSLTLGLVLNWVKVLPFGTPGFSTILWIGIGLMLLGLILRHWSIISLGRFFRTTIELEKDQKVIENGPYRYIRHPSYAGIILFFIGYGITSKDWISLGVAVCLPTASLIYRIQIEEKALAEGMGPDYVAYQKKTKKLLPGIW